MERSRIVLLEKRLPRDVELVDLAQKPAWFLVVSPMGRAPVLLVDGAAKARSAWSRARAAE